MSRRARRATVLRATVRCAALAAATVAAHAHPLAAQSPGANRFLARATARRQFELEWERDAWFADDRWRLLTRLEYSRFPLRFYGLGVDAPETAEELYTPRTPAATVTVQRRIVPGLYAGAGYAIARTTMRGLDPEGVLVDGTVRGSRGGTVAQLDLSLVADTRDNVYAPRRGHLATLQWSPARRAFGSSFDFSRTLLDARGYRPLGARTSIAAQAVLDDVRGAAPFDRLPTIGTSSVMRAYERGRYRDGTLAAAQVELRRDLPRGFAGAVWVGAGTVAPRLGALGDARLLPSAGVGGRWFLLPGERLAVRADVAVGRGVTGIYLGVGEAF
ncbi:MAG: BamA/TamA family outer membrane protein [Gemmatimonadaceae bacterium]|nr:BamA/TamA family outer membrane protein [Gemmatimonadaceae bacterium]